MGQHYSDNLRYHICAWPFLHPICWPCCYYYDDHRNMTTDEFNSDGDCSLREVTQQPIPKPACPASCHQQLVGCDDQPQHIRLRYCQRQSRYQFFLTTLPAFCLESIYLPPCSEMKQGLIEDVFWKKIQIPSCLHRDSLSASFRLLYLPASKVI